MSSGIIAQPLTKALLRWLLGRREAVAAQDPATGRFVLHYGKPMRTVAVCLLVLSTALMALGLAGGRDDPQALAIFMLIFGAMWAASVWAIYEAFIVKIHVSRDGLYRGAGSGREVHLPWSAITGVTYSESMNWLVYRARGNGAVRVSIFRNGLATLANLTAARCDGESARVASAILHEAAPAGPALRGES